MILVLARIQLIVMADCQDHPFRVMEILFEDADSIWETLVAWRRSIDFKSYLNCFGCCISVLACGERRP